MIGVELIPYHTKLALTTFLKMLPNRLKLCTNEMDVVAMCYDLFTNFMDGLGREGAPEHYLRHNLAKVTSSSPTTARVRCYKNGQGRFENYFGVTEP